MEEQMLIRINSNTKDRFEKIARNEGKSMSQVVRELIDVYVSDHDIAGYMNDLWDRVGSDLAGKKVSSKDIDKAIRNVRSGE